MYPVCVLLGECGPGTRCAGGEFGALALQEVAIGCCQGICCVHIGQHGVVCDMQNLLQHGCHLLLAGRTVSGDGLFDFEGGILMDRYLTAYRSGDGNALCPAQFEHALHIFSKERGFNSQFIGIEGINDAYHSLIYTSEFEICVTAFAQVDDTHRLHFSLLSFHAYYAISQHVGTGIYAKNDFFCGSHSAKVGIHFRIRHLYLQNFLIYRLTCTFAPFNKPPEASVKRKPVSSFSCVMIMLNVMTMKRVYSLLALAFVCSAAFAQAVIKFEKSSFDFGKFIEKDVQSCEFVFTNTGNEPLVIQQAYGSCGCTVATPPKEPVAPGQKGVIKVTYNGKGKFVGFFKKPITVRSNATNAITRVYIQGTMVADK